MLGRGRQEVVLLGAAMPAAAFTATPVALFAATVFAVAIPAAAALLPAVALHVGVGRQQHWIQKKFAWFRSQSSSARPSTPMELQREATASVATSKPDSTAPAPAPSTPLHQPHHWHRLGHRAMAPLLDLDPNHWEACHSVQEWWEISKPEPDMKANLMAE
uniref:Uncharacterized protein n=1 Tax=Oryza punctata TaxID=4537 RepID=A0A0E0L3D6_ORYPU